MGYGRAEGSSAIADGGHAAVSLIPDVIGMNICIFESLQLEGLYVGELLYLLLETHTTLAIFQDMKILSVDISLFATSFLLSSRNHCCAKSLQSCPTLCDLMDGSPSGSSVPGILQARILEWVALSFSNACMHAKSLQSCLTLCDPMDRSPRGYSVHGIF